MTSPSILFQAAAEEAARVAEAKRIEEERLAEERAAAEAARLEELRIAEEKAQAERLQRERAVAEKCEDVEALGIEVQLREKPKQDQAEVSKCFSFFLSHHRQYHSI